MLIETNSLHIFLFSRYQAGQFCNENFNSLIDYEIIVDDFMNFEAMNCGHLNLDFDTQYHYLFIYLMKLYLK